MLTFLDETLFYMLTFEKEKFWVEDFYDIFLFYLIGKFRFINGCKSLTTISYQILGSIIINFNLNSSLKWLNLVTKLDVA